MMVSLVCCTLLSLVLGRASSFAVTSSLGVPRGHGFLLDRTDIPVQVVVRRRCRLLAEQVDGTLQLRIDEDKYVMVKENTATAITKEESSTDGSRVVVVDGSFTETALRSAVKAICWRLLSGMITLFTALRFSGSLETALKIFGFGFLPKASAMFLCDRVMNKSRLGQVSGATRRSLLKASLWRLISIISNLIIALFVSKDLSVASKIVSSEAVLKTALLFFYERHWSTLSWGKQHKQAFLMESERQPRALTPPTVSLSLTGTGTGTGTPNAVEGKSLVKDPSVVGQSSEKDPSFDWQNQWFPVMPLDYLAGSENQNQPFPVTILGRLLVVWKSGEKEWSVFEDICPHRQSPLSTGQVIDGCLKCRYHGWEFESGGKCATVPMKTTTTKEEAYHATSFPTRLVGGLLWVYLGRQSNDGGASNNDEIPEIPPDAIPSEEDVDGADWMFNLNPISYLSMMENTFDPAHAPFTHEGMMGFAGMAFSPNDTVPMEKYELTEKASQNGFTLQHTPYQLTTARAAGLNSTTTRKFIPPTTVSVSSLPFFQTKMWFVPSTPYDTNVMAFFKTPETRLLKCTRRFPKLQRFLKDSAHTRQYIGDWNYRFLSQDRITMQGQDQRKAGKVRKADLTPTPSDVGVATFQYWTEKIAGGGPFHPSLADRPKDFSRELSMWESHGKYCPSCQRSMRRVSALQRAACKWSSRSLVCSVATASAAGLSSFLSRSVLARVLVLVSLQLVVASVCLRATDGWCRRQESRMYSIGHDLWRPQNSVFGYRRSD
jgi:phenylpropionate dioxygenase-like ring-hydroxylating dioxygenase large terminal subunit/uncharacterized membrane protein